MTDIIKKIKKYKWDLWLERPFQAFVQSLFEDATRKETYEKLGFKDITLRAQVFQNHIWFINSQILEEFDGQIEKYLENHTIFDVTKSMSDFKEERESKIKELEKIDLSINEKFLYVYETLKYCCSYIWLAHGLESYYKRKLEAEVPKYITGDIEKFIGDASFPLKKNEHTLMEEMMRTNASNEEIAEKFAWIKSRDGFSDPFTTKEISDMRADLKPHETPDQVNIPTQLKDLISEVQELVYFRTARTDMFYQLFFISRPILREFAKSINIPFEELKFYRAKKLLDSVKEKYSPGMAFVYLDGEVLFQEEPIIVIESQDKINEFKGNVAYKGIIKGTVKIIKDVSELEKVKLGDILVTQMTFPSFIPAMIKASAFVTDEGGITCHATIVAREMKKPCVIGTKIATKVLKDGDVVEVDADKGIVRKIT